MNKKEWLRIWLKERDDVIRTQDVEKFKAFYQKWKDRGLYHIPIPADEVIEIALRKSLYHLASATDEEKAYAEKWLKDHGSSVKLD